MATEGNDASRAPQSPAQSEPQTLSEALLGTEVLNSPMLAKVRAWPAEFRSTLVAVLFAGTIFVPFLGSVGLWDPWEVHYGEVAREMIQRNDYVHPFWENAWFFSKPAFTMWMQALGLQAAEGGTTLALILGVLLAGFGAALVLGKAGKPSHSKEFWGVTLCLLGALALVLFGWGKAVSLPWKFAGVAGGDGALPVFTEWGFRLPFALFSILGVGLMTYAMTIAVNARAALASAFVLVTMPLYFLLSRQAVTDTPIVAATISGVACAMVGLFDKQSKHRSEWWYGSYVFFAIATLAKGLLGFGVPMMVFIFYVAIGVLPWTWRSWKEHASWAMRHLLPAMGTGIVAGVIAGFIAYSLGVRLATTFMAVPIVDNVSLISAPAWLGIMWGSLAFWAGTTVQLGLNAKKVTEKPPALFAMAYDMRLGTGILLFLAVSLPWYYEMFTFWRLDDESKVFWFRFIIHDHFARLGSGVHTTTPGGDFTYFILQGGYAMFPWVALIPGAMATLARSRPRGGTGFDGVALIATLWFAFTFALIGESATKFHHYVFSMLPPLAIAMGLFIDKLWEEGVEAHAVNLLFGVPLFLLVGKDLVATPKDFTDLFVYNYDRPYPLKEVVERFGVQNTLRNLMMAMGGAAAIFAMARSRVWLFASTLATVAAFALWFNWSHWVDLSHHWTQRDQFWRYYTQRRPGEPIAAFLMNWRGETFYSRNMVKQIKDNPNVGMNQYAAQPGREWSLVEHNRLGILKSAVGPDKNVTLIDKDLNNKFVLVTIE